MIASTRADLVATLAEYLTIPVYGTLPDQPRAPACYLTEASQFVTVDPDAPTFGAWIVQFEGWVIVAGNVTNQRMTGDADKYAAQLVQAATAYRLATLEVGGYQTTTINGLPAVVVPFAVSVDLIDPTQAP